MKYAALAESVWPSGQKKTVVPAPASIGAVLRAAVASITVSAFIPICSGEGKYMYDVFVL